VSGRAFNGLDNIGRSCAMRSFWNALGNMVWYVLAVLVQYAIAFALACCSTPRSGHASSSASPSAALHAERRSP